MDRDALEELLDHAVRSGAQRLHLISGRRPCVRVQGRLVQGEGEPVGEQQLHALLAHVLPADRRRRLDSGGEVEAMFVSAAGVRFRVGALCHADGLQIDFRRVPDRVPGLTELGLPDGLGSLAELRRGLILVTGHVGSGKSTTLAAMLEHRRAGGGELITTVGDAVEFTHGGGEGSLVVQREVGTDVPGFVAGIRDARSSGTDVLVVDEVRDAPSFDAVLSAAESGMLVLASCSAASVAGALSELLAMIAPEHRDRARGRLAEALRVVVSQTLVARAHSKGRLPLLEVLINDAGARRALRSGDLAQLPRIMERGHGLGMQTTDQALRELVQRNLITMDEALDHATDRDRVSARSGRTGGRGTMRSA